MEFQKKTAIENLFQANYRNLIRIFLGLRTQSINLALGFCLMFLLGMKHSFAQDATAPLSAITSLPHSAWISLEVPIVISGTAADTGGGVVAGVQISTNDGATWESATGTENWTYEWTPTMTGEINIKVRAFDNNNNIENEGTPPSANAITITITGEEGPFSLWNYQTIPAIISDSDESAIELGVRFRPLTNGHIAGIRFYKSAANTGTHIGSLWSSAGNSLAQATFTEETTSGWQQVYFNTPIPVTANTVYVASYHTNTGHYSYSADYFSSTHSTPFLQAPAALVGAPNGVYKVSSNRAFPDQQAVGSGNLWVDVIFLPTIGEDTTGPAVLSVSPANEATEISVTTNISVEFDEAIDPNSLNDNTFELRNSNNELVPADITYNDASFTATLAPQQPLPASATFIIILKGESANPHITDVAGNALADFESSFTTSTVSTNPQTITFAPLGDKTIGDDPFQVTASSSSGLPVDFNVSGPASISGSLITLTGTGTVTVTASQPGNALYEPAEPVIRTFNILATNPEPGPFYIFSPTTAPAGPADNDAGAIELGIKFRPLVNGFITGIRYYKSAGNTGTHIGNLWNTNGDNLARATFVNETGTGWQEVLFGTPVAVTANSTYVASYHTSTGHYFYTANGLVNSRTTPYLQSLAGGTEGANGVFTQSTSTSFPNTATSNSANLWVDVVFATSLGEDTTAPSVASTTPADGATGVSPGSAITATFTENIDQSTLTTTTFQLKDNSDNVIPAILSYNTSTFIATLTPTSPLESSTVYTATLKGGSTAPQIKDPSGNALAADVAWSFTTSSLVKTQQTISFPTLNNKTFGDASFSVPATASSGLPVSLEIVSGPANISGNTITLTGAGEVTIIASQAGNSLFESAPTVSRTFTIFPGSIEPGPFTIWSATTIPSTTDDDNSAIELGVKFRPVVDGFITGIRYYKSSTNTGTHIGNLWSSTGTNLASATFTDETTTGWQEVLFDSPVEVSAGITYVASYHTSTGHYAFDANYFSSAKTTPYLEALAAGTDGPNGVFIASASSAFPTFAAGSSGNLWVDVVFMTDLPAKDAQTITFAELSDMTYGDAAFSLTASATSGLPVAFSVSGPATLSDNTLTITGAGEVSVTAAQAGNDDFEEAAPVIRTFNVNKAEQLITWASPTAIASGTALGDTQLNASVEGVSGGTAPGALNYSPESGTVLPVGTHNLTVTAASTSNYNQASKTVSITVTTNDQTITFAELSDKTYGDAAFSLTASATSGLPVAFSVSGPATLSDNTLTITGAGEVSVTASQIGNDDYDEAVSVIRTFNVSKAEQIITWATPAAIASGTALGGTQLNASVEGISGGTAPGALTYNPVSGTVLPVGTHNLTVTAASTSNYNQASKTVSITVTTNNQTITFAELDDKTYGDAAFSLTASATSGLPVAFSVSGPATLSDNTLTITGAGEVSVTAAQGGNDDYDEAVPVIRTFNVSKAEQIITWATPAAIASGTALGGTQLNASVEGISGGTAPGALTYSPVSGTVLPVGTHNLTVTAASTSNYNQASRTVSIIVTTNNQTITFAELSDKTYGDAAFSLTASATSGLPVAFSVSGPATLSDNTLTITGAGEVSVTASQVGNDDYDEAVPVIRTFNVNKAEQLITWATPAAIASGTALGGTQLNASVEGISGGTAPGALTYSPVSGTVLPVGTHNLTVTAASTSNYNQASKTVSITVTTNNQTITFAELSDKTYGDAAFSLTASATSGLPVAFSVSGPATLSDNTLTITGAGEVSVTASQIGNDDYDEAVSVIRTFNVSKAEQLITWATPAAIASGTALGDTQLNASVEGISGGTAPGALTYSPESGTVLPVGTHNLTVTAASTSNYNQASRTVSIIVTTNNQTITFAELSDKTYGDAAFSLTASATSGLPVAFSVSGPATLSANTLTITGAGEVSVTASQIGNDDYDEAVPVIRTFNVNKAEQLITWATPAAIASGTALGDTQLNASVEGISGGTAPGALTYSPVSGTVLPVGTHNLTVTAASTSNYNQASRTVSLVVTGGITTLTEIVRINAGGPAVQFGTQNWLADRYFSGGRVYTSTSAISNTTNDALYRTERFGNFNYNIPVPQSGNYTVELHFAELYFSASGSRLFNVNVESGQFQLQNIDLFKDYGGRYAASVITAQNVQVTDGVLNINLSGVIENAKISGIAIFLQGEEPVNRPPIVAKPANVTLTTGQSWNYQVNASDPDAGAVLTYSATNLPASLAINPITGLISGSVTTPGTYTVDLAVEDQTDLSAATSFVITITLPMNRPPMVSKPTDITLASGHSWTYQVVASDPDPGAVLAYSATNLPASLAINSSTGLISGTLSAAAGPYTVTLSVKDQQNLTAMTDFLITITSSSALSEIVRINAGGPALQFGTQNWLADQYFSGGRVYTSTSAISNTTNDALYRTERFGNFNYNIPVPQSGSYTVELHFAELYFSASGSRLFNVNVESGQFQLQNIDLFKDYGGRYAASVVTAQNVQVTDGVLNINLSGMIENAKISGIAVFLQGEAPANRPPVVVKPANVTLTTGQSWTYQVNASDPDAGAVLTYSATNLPASLALDPGTGLITGTVTNSGTYTVNVSVKDQQDATGNTSFVITVEAPVLTEIVRINAGGPAIQFGSQTWSADNYFSGGRVYSNTSAISNTTNDALFQTERYNTNMTYSIPVPQAGLYTVELYFAELYHNTSGARLFNVNVESGQFLLQNLDLFKDYGGRFAASIITAKNIQVNDGFLTINFTRLIDNAKISGIAVFLQGTLGGSSVAMVNTPITAENSGKRMKLRERPIEQIVKLGAYPNPFARQATISFTMPTDEELVTLDVYDLKGIRIRRLYEGKTEANQAMKFEFDGTGFSPGMYFLRLTSPKRSENFKMIMTE